MDDAASTDYRQQPAVSHERIDVVAHHYHRLTGRPLWGKVWNYIAVITRLHGDESEARMEEGLRRSGVDDLLWVLANTQRGDPLVEPRSRGATAGRAASSRAGERVGRTTAATAPARPPVKPTSIYPDPPGRPDAGGRHGVDEGLESDPMDEVGSMPRPASAPGTDAAGRLPGLIHGPASRPSIAGTANVRRDLSCWQAEATRRAEHGDFTGWAAVVFWDLLSDADRERAALTVGRGLVS